jgi:hypothetical protein
MIRDDSLLKKEKLILSGLAQLEIVRLRVDLLLPRRRFDLRLVAYVLFQMGLTYW